MTKVVEVTAKGMFNKTGMKHALGYSLPKEDTILVRKGLDENLRKKVLEHEEEHMMKGEEGPFSLGGLLGSIAKPVLGAVGSIFGGPVGGAVGAGIGSALFGSKMASNSSPGGSRQTQNYRTFSQANPFSFNTGLFRGGFNRGRVSFGMSPEMQQLQEAGIANAQLNQANLLPLSQTLLSKYGGALAGFNPETAAQDLYSQLSPARERDFQNQYLGLENRLFNQGRLGSTGILGAQAPLEALFRAQEAQRAKDLFKSYGLAQDAQKTLFGLLSGSAALPGSVLQQDLSPVFGIQKAAMEPFGVFGNLAGASGTNTNVANMQRIAPGLGYSVGTGLMQAGGDILGNVLKGIFNKPKVPSLSESTYAYTPYTRY